MNETYPVGRADGHQDEGASTAAEATLVERPAEALAVAYQETHTTIVSILGGLGRRKLSTLVPACPAWTVRELVAHMAGTAADAITARFPVVNPHGDWAERRAIIDAFTADQVASRQGLSLDEVLAEWSEHVTILTRMLSGRQAFPTGSIPIIDWMVVCDIAVHDQDLRGALDMPGDRDSAGVALSLQRYVAGLSQRITSTALPALHLQTEHGEYVAGHGAPTSTVATSRWELFRALCSRRSASQIRAYQWSGGPESYLPLFGAYGLPNRDLVE